MSVINDRLRVQTYAYRACEYIYIYAWRAPVIWISYIALVNDKHVGGDNREFQYQ